MSMLTADSPMMPSLGNVLSEQELASHLRLDIAAMSGYVFPWRKIEQEATTEAGKKRQKKRTLKAGNSTTIDDLQPRQWVGRRKLLSGLCARSGVRAFDFHGIRIQLLFSGKKSGKIIYTNR